MTIEDARLLRRAMTMVVVRIIADDIEMRFALALFVVNVCQIRV